MAKITTVDGITIEGSVEEIAELMAKFSGKQTDEPTLKEGDKVRIIGPSIFGVDHVGEIGTFDGIDSDGDHSVIFEHIPQRLYKRENIELVTDEQAEVAEPAPLKVGDYAKVVEGASVSSLAVGDIVKLDERGVAYGFRTSRVYDGESEPFDFEDLIRATEAEVASAKAQAEADAIERKRNAIFTENGRKVNEYREGDIVTIIENNSGSCNNAGDIGVITEVTKINVSVQVGGRDDGGNCSVFEDIKPLVFVESRLDRK